MYGAFLDGHDREAAVLIARALDFAYEEGELNPKFFLLNDAQALNYLAADERNPLTRKLVKLARAKAWYQHVWGIRTQSPTQALRDLARRPDARASLALEIHEATGIPNESIGVEISEKGRDFRRFHQAFEADDGTLTYDDPEETPIARCRVSVDSVYAYKAEAVQAFMDTKVA